MKFFLEKLIYIAQFHFQDPNTDPDPAWQFESGFNLFVYRNTGIKYWYICTNCNCKSENYSS